VAETKDYSALVSQAEKAVAAVKDPELKRIAFQKILESLFADGEARPGAAEGPKASPRRAAKKPTKASKPARGGPARYLSELIEEGFFNKPKTIAQVKGELENRGHHIPLSSLSGPLQKKCQQRELRRQKVKAAGKKETFAYSNW
jgi:hypothetical protein